MIRFSCPGCSATYSVGDEKAGKSGQCPKCQAQFTIPAADATTAPAPPPAPPPLPPSSGPVEIAPCPGCKAKLSVERGDLGTDVECPYCKTVFSAKLPGSGTTSSGSTRRPARQDDNLDVVPSGRSLRDSDEERPSRRSRREEYADEEERPSRRGRRDDDDDEERPSRRSRRRDDDDDDDRPRRRRRGGGDSPALGIISLVAGILAIIFSCCCLYISPVFSLAAIITGVLGMKTSGRGMAIAGTICGVVAIVLAIGLFFLGLTLNLANQGGGFPGPNQQQKQKFR